MLISDWAAWRLEPPEYSRLQAACLSLGLQPFAPGSADAAFVEHVAQNGRNPDDDSTDLPARLALIRQHFPEGPIERERFIRWAIDVRLSIPLEFVQLAEGVNVTRLYSVEGIAAAIGHSVGDLLATERGGSREQYRAIAQRFARHARLRMRADGDSGLLPVDRGGQARGIDLVTLEAITAWLAPQRSAKGRELGKVGIGGLRAYWRLGDGELSAEDGTEEARGRATALDEQSKAEWYLGVVRRDDGLAGLVHGVLLKAKQAQSERPPNAREVVRALAEARPAGFLRASADSVDYLDTKGVEASAELDAIRKRIERLTKAPG